MIKKLLSMKLKITFFIMLSLSITLISGCRQDSDNQVPEYLIDINVYNQTDYNIDKIALYEKVEGQDNFITETQEDGNEYIHFAVSYHTDVLLYLKGIAGNKEIPPYEFTLEGFEESSNPQALIIDLVEIDGKLQLDKRK